MPMRWDKIHGEERTKRYGKEDVSGNDLPPQARPFGGARWKKRPPPKPMTPEEKARWKDAIAKVYKKDS